MPALRDLRLSHPHRRADPGAMTSTSRSPAAGLPDAGITACSTAAGLPTAVTAPAAGDEVLAPLRAYIRGHATGDPAHFRAAFLPTAHVEGMRKGTFVSWRLDDYCALFHGQPAPDEPTRSRRIDAVHVHGSVAMASMTLEHGADTFTDVFLLVCVDGQWRIANKAYHRH
jgi:Putative lumazine-binding